MTTRTSTFTRAKLAAAGGAALAAVLALSSCAGADPSDSGSGSNGALRVVTTTTQLTDFAAQIGGDDIELTGLLQPGASAHHFDPTPADLLAVGEADVLIVNGLGLDEFVDDAIEASGFEGKIITAADGIDLELAETISNAEEAGDPAAATEDDDHDHGGADDHDHDHADHDHDHDHDHGSVNPHIWTSPKNASLMAREITDGLIAADPDHEAAYTDRFEAYAQQLGALDTWASEQFERVPAAERVMVSGHNSLVYYLYDYDIELAGMILPSFDDNAEPSAAEIEDLAAFVKSHGVKAIFVESSMNPKLAQTLGREAGVQVITDKSLYADSLAAPGEEGDTYVGATIHNTRLILEAWGFDPDPLPEELQP